MKELLRVGRRGALLKVCDTPKKYELVSAYSYDEKSNSWGQGHYFTLWFGDVTEENKAKLFERANQHFEENYL